MGKQYSQKTLEERKQQMAEILQNLENGVKEHPGTCSYTKEDLGRGRMYQT